MSALTGIDALVAACGGCTPVRLLVSASDGSERDLGTPQRPYLIVGRSAQCDVQLEGSDVSHRHAYIQIIGNRVYCADLGSRTGVHWHDGMRPSSWVGFEEHLAIGQYGLRFAIGDDELAAKSEQTAIASSNRPEISLRFLNARVNTDRSRQWPIRRTVSLLGHLPSCHIPLRDASVSRVHASLLRTSLGVWVIDLLGKDGVEVNGERVAFARLSDGDVLKVGRFRMEVESSSASGVIEPNHHHHALTTSPQFSLTGPQRMLPTNFDQATKRIAASQNASSEAADSAREVAARQPAAAQGGLSESFVLSLLNQSASMQQQMAAQQHQMMMLTMQMFSKMHGQHTKLVREELECVKELTREIRQIQAQLAGQAPAPPARDQQEADLDSPQPAILPLIPPGGERAKLGSKPQPGAPVRKQRPAIGNAAAKLGPAAHLGAAAERIPAGLDGDALQTHLAARLAELERKRSGYWQKIARVMMG